MKQDKVFKLGLDVHGVISQHPIMFGQLSHILANAGHEVHILTGKEITDEFREWLSAIGMTWTHIFSISEHLRQAGEAVRYLDHENPVFDNTDAWNRAKAEYCEKNEIDLHIDDSQEYLDNFTTPAALFFATNCYVPPRKKIADSSE